MREEEAYERWLLEVSAELQTAITSEDVKGKSYILNLFELFWEIKR